ncbi:MAG: acyl carrier protein [Lachnospiraceae bacterium]|nr:acyl carrier protein [Lachnospiraceae bacterium]
MANLKITFENLKEVIIDIFYLESDEYEKINNETDFFQDLNMDSITFFSLICELEERYDFKFDDEMEIDSVFGTVGNLLNYLNK